MRSRNLKPGFFKNEILAECDPLTRLLFQGLWCMADREGRLEYRPRRIKAEILPYDKCDVVASLTRLRDLGFIICYPADPVRFIQVVNFTKHQNCHIKEQASTIPTPCEHDACTVQKLPLTESLFPLTESLLPQPAARCLTDTFETFWKAYPKKKSRGQAEKVWLKINPDEQLLAKMIAIIERAKKSEEWIKEKGKYIPHPATWLNAKGWEDEETEVHPLSRIMGESGLKTAMTIGTMELET